MEDHTPVDLVFLWHHHQPDYRAPRDGVALLPWVRLHATKDYLDMARRLERHPGLHAAFNFVPSLLDQIEDAALGAPDLLFDRLARDPASMAGQDREELIARLRIAPRWAFERWPAYAELSRAPDPSIDDAVLIGLETFFLLAWLDPSFHGEREAAAANAAQPRPSLAQRDALLALHHRLIGEVIGAYRALAEHGQIELSISPYDHPILPLLIDTRHALRARSDAVLPREPFIAPEDAEAQVRRAIERHSRAFGGTPRGMWPSEGSVSPEVAAIAARCGVRWMASDEGVLWRSLPAGNRDREALYRPWNFATAGGEVAMLFRDHELSDRIGFVYQHWGAGEAVADLIDRLRRIGREHAGSVPPLVSIILDGENCWEHYPEDGGPFLDALYDALDRSADIRTRTPSQAIAERTLETLPALHTGSWIDGDFHIWVGSHEKNRAWELVGLTRRALVDSGATRSSHPAAWEALEAAEGSDWFWWFGDDHFTPERSTFDRLFREHLQAALERAGISIPGELRLPVGRDGQRGSASDPIGLITPVIDGRESSFYEWHEAGCVERGAGGSMHRGAGRARRLFYGFDAEALYLRLDFDGPIPDVIDIEFLAPHAGRVRVSGLAPGAARVDRIDAEGGTGPLEGARAAGDRVIEVALPLASLSIRPGDEVGFMLHVLEHGRPVESLPDDGAVRLRLRGGAFEGGSWSA